MAEQKVDVIAVLDWQITHTRQHGGSPSVETLSAARDAVAELIEALQGMMELVDGTALVEFDEYAIARDVLSRIGATP